MGLLDGQQRTLAMLLGWPDVQSNQHCMWIDLSENGHAGSPFELRITTETQPFGFQRFLHVRLSREDRKQARIKYDAKNPEYEEKRDYELFGLEEIKQPRPWKTSKNADCFLRLKDAWGAFREGGVDGMIGFYRQINELPGKSEVNENKLTSLYDAFERLELLQVPLVLIPEHISHPQQEVSGSSTTREDAPSPLILLFERIGRNGASLSTEDLLFSLIKQEWPEAHDLVEKIHRESKVGYLMSSTDYVMTAFRLASADAGIVDNPRPKPDDFHRHLGILLGKDGDGEGQLRKYLKDGVLVSAFNLLYDAIKYRNKDDKDAGFPDLMMPHFSRGLIQVLLQWIMLNPDEKMIAESRDDIIAFALFWYLCVWKTGDDDKASKIAFESIKIGVAFPATALYKILTDAQTENDIGMALPLVSPERLEAILINEESSLLRSSEGMFRKDGDEPTTVQERELYKRFCWWRKPLLLWFQRAYIQRNFSNYSLSQFANLTDEDTVPYDYDHLCPQDHWGTDWRNIEKNSSSLPKNVSDEFRKCRSDVGNCIGNLHVLESSLNRSFGDAPLVSKLKEEGESKKWCHRDSLLYHCDKHEKLWKTASPDADDENDKKKNQTWNEIRLQAFQSAVYRRSKGFYCQYYEACKHIMLK